MTDLYEIVRDTGDTGGFDRSMVRSLFRLIRRSFHPSIHTPIQRSIENPRDRSSAHSHDPLTDFWIDRPIRRFIDRSADGRSVDGPSDRSIDRSSDRPIRRLVSGQPFSCRLVPKSKQKRATIAWLSFALVRALCACRKESMQHGLSERHLKSFWRLLLTGWPS